MVKSLEVFFFKDTISAFTGEFFFLNLIQSWPYICSASWKKLACLLPVGILKSYRGEEHFSRPGDKKGRLWKTIFFRLLGLWASVCSKKRGGLGSPLDPLLIESFAGYWIARLYFLVFILVFINVHVSANHITSSFKLYFYYWIKAMCK